MVILGGIGLVLLKLITMGALFKEPNMKMKLGFSLIVIALMLSLSLGVQAQTKTYRSTTQGDVEYNATEKSPTLPLVQTPPPQNSPSGVIVGAPSYYYYYNYPGAYGGGGGYYGNTPQAGVGFFNVNGRTTRTFWATTPIPGQVSPLGGGGYGPGYGGPGGYGPGYGPGYGGGFYPPYIGNTLFTP